MKKIDKLLTEMRLRYGNQESVTIYFMNRTNRKFTFLDAIQICANDPNVIDATTGDDTGTSLLRAIIDGDNDFSELE